MKLSYLTRALALALLCGAGPLASAQDHAAPAAAAEQAEQAEHSVLSDAEQAAEHAVHETSPFAGGIGNAVLTLIIFAAVVYILGKKAWPPLLKVLDEREQSIRGALQEARQERIEAEKLLAQYRKQIDQAREEATAIVEEGRRDAQAVQRRMHEEAQRESQEMIERAKREIKLAADSAVKELYDRTAELAVQVAGGIIRKELSPADHRDLVTQSLERMKAGSQN